MKEFENNQIVTREELEATYTDEMKWYKKYRIQRDFDKFTECFWILFNDGANSYMWAIDTVCRCYPECDRNNLEKILDRYI